MKLSVIFENKEKENILSVANLLQEQRQKLCDCMDCSSFHGCEACPMASITDNLQDIIDRLETLTEEKENKKILPKPLDK